MRSTCSAEASAPTPTVTATGTTMTTNANLEFPPTNNNAFLLVDVLILTERSSNGFAPLHRLYSAAANKPPTAARLGENVFVRTEASPPSAWRNNRPGLPVLSPDSLDHGNPFIQKFIILLDDDINEIALRRHLQPPACCCVDANNSTLIDVLIRGKI